jgi:hypothetical protein
MLVRFHSDIKDMGVWRAIFGWQTLLRWDVLGALVPGIFFAVGLAMLGLDWWPHNLFISQVAFTVAGSLGVLKTVAHAIETQGSKVSRFVFVVVVSFVLIASMVWADIVIQKHKSKSSRMRSEEPLVPRAVPSETPQTIPSTATLEVKPPARSAGGKPMKDPLQVIELNSNVEITVANNGRLPIYVLRLVIDNPTPPGGSKSFGLDFDIKAGNVHKEELTEGFREFGTLPRLANTWMDHFSKARELYGSCGMQLTYFSPSDPGFLQFKHHYEKHSVNLGFENISGVVSYHVQGSREIKQQTVPIAVATTVKADCLKPPPASSQ